LRALAEGVPAGVVAGFCEHPGAEDRSQPGLGGDDLSVRVPPKIGLDLPLQGFHLLVQGGQHRDEGAHGGGVCRGHDGGLAQVPGAQHRLDPLRLPGDAAAAGALEGRADLRDGQLRRRRRVRCPAQQFQGVRRVEVLERLHRGGEVIPQRMPQPLGAPGAFPDQRLVRPRHHLDRRGQRGVPGHRPQLMRVGAHHVRQDMSVTGVAFGTRHAVPFPVPGRLQRVDREHRVPGRDQRGHPRAPVRLDPHRDLPRVVLIGVLAELLADHRMQPRDARHPLGQPGLRQPPARHVHQLDVVMVG
jgi:hypothetical protein